MKQDRLSRPLAIRWWIWRLAKPCTWMMSGIRPAPARSYRIVALVLYDAKATEVQGISVRTGMPVYCPACSGHGREHA